MEKSIELMHPLWKKCDNPRFVFNVVIIMYSPELKLDLFAVKDTLATYTWSNMYCAMDTLERFRYT